LEKDVANNMEKVFNTTYSSAANLLSESLATLNSHNKYTKNYCKMTENNIRTERFILEYLETYSMSSSWNSEERTRKLSILGEKVAALLLELRNKHPGRAERHECKEVSTQTNLDYLFEQSYISFKTPKGIYFDDW